MTSLLSDQEIQIDTVTNDNDAIKEPKLPDAIPQLIQSGGISSPSVPSEIKETGIDATLITELALNLANSVPNLTTPWAAQQICLPMQLIDEVCTGNSKGASIISRCIQVRRSMCRSNGCCLLQPTSRWRLLPIRHFCVVWVTGCMLTNRHRKLIVKSSKTTQLDLT